MTKNKTPTDDGALRATMRTLSRRSLADLRAAYQRTHEKDPGTMSRDALIKSLLAHADAQPPASHPTKGEQAAAKTPRPPRPSKRKRDERFPAPGGSVTREYKGKSYTLEVLEQGFRVGTTEFRSPTAAAREVTGYKAISGPLFWGVTKPAEAPDAATETPAPMPPSPVKRKAGRPIGPKRKG